MKSNNREDEAQRQHKHNNGVDLKTGGLVGVELYAFTSAHILHLSAVRPAGPSTKSPPRTESSLIGGEHTQHSRAAPARTSRTRARRSGIRRLRSPIGGSATTNGGLGAAGGGRGGWPGGTDDIGAGGGGGGGTRGAGLRGGVSLRVAGSLGAGSEGDSGWGYHCVDVGDYGKCRGVERTGVRFGMWFVRLWEWKVWC